MSVKDVHCSHLFVQRRLVIALGSKHSIHWLHHSCHFFFINGTTFVGIVAEIVKTYLWMLTLLLTCEKPILAFLLESLRWRGPLLACSPWSPSNHSRRDQGSLVVMMKMHKDFVFFKSTTWIYDPESELFLILLATTLQTRCKNNLIISTTFQLVPSWPDFALCEMYRISTHCL